MRFESLPQFYRSKEWADCKAYVLAERMNGGVVYCEHCHSPILKSFNPNERNNKMAMVFHHKTYLTLANVNDANVSINPANIAILHWKCHNEVHGRFGFGTNQRPEKKVYLVTGAPFSGKREWVDQRIQAGDILLDIDSIWECLSGQPMRSKPNQLKPAVFQVRSLMKDMIAKGTGTWRNAFVVECLSTPRDIDTEANRYRAHNVEIVTMEATEAECLDRLRMEKNGIDEKEYAKYIADYFRSR
jgi:hypothetical protein